MHLVLLVEDDADLRGILRALLQAGGYRVVETPSAARARIETRSHRPDVVLLDLGLPDQDGVEVIRWLRTWSPVPIIVLSARAQEDQKIQALDAGADDFVTKPFASGELLARLRSATRRVPQSAIGGTVIHVGEVRLDLAARSATGRDRAVHFTPLEFRVLECLARRPGMIVTREQLLREVWGARGDAEVGSLRVIVKRLRDKLEPDPRQPAWLLTEIGLGYRLLSNLERSEQEPP